MRFNERLRELRVLKGMTQEKLGDILHVSKMAVSHWESGHSEPSIEQLIQISNIFDTSVDYLVGKED